MKKLASEAIKPAESDAITPRHVASAVGTNDGASSDRSNHDATQTVAAAAQPTTATPRHRLGCPGQGRCGWRKPFHRPGRRGTRTRRNRAR